MKEIDSLINKALKYKESGLTDYEVAEELNVSKDTAVWLLNKGKQKKPEGDVKIGWRSIGVYPSRIAFLSDALTDIAVEEIEQRGLEPSTVVGVALNGIPFATYIAEALGLELAIFRPHHEKSGAFSSNFASVKEKDIIIIDDVVGSGETLKGAIKATKLSKGNPVLLASIVNKRAQNDIGGVPLRALIRARAL